MRSAIAGYRILAASAWAFLALARAAAADVLYTDVTNGQFVGTAFSAVGWADYDRDDDLDVLISGATGTHMYRNEGGGIFTDLGSIGLPSAWEGGLAWGDYDHDLDLDLLLTGTTDGTPSATIIRLYDNNGSGTLSLHPLFGISGLYQGPVIWGDYEHDGDLDVLYAGLRQSGSSVARFTNLLRQEGGNFFLDGPTCTTLPGTQYGAAAFADYNNDGLLDLALTGVTSAGPRLASIYRNPGGCALALVPTPALEGVMKGSLAWGDFDNDNDPDLLVTGESSSLGRISRVYRNDGGDTFSDINAPLTGLAEGSAAWGDCDGDGDLDILLTGSTDGTEGGARTLIYRNEGAGAFVSMPTTGLVQVFRGASAWADFDDDDDLDLLLTGQAGPPEYGYVTRLYRNDGSISGVDEAPPVAALALSHAPNPFTASTHLGFTLAAAAAVELHVFDAAGRRVRTLHDGRLGAGPHDLAWDGRDDAGRRVAAGRYFAALRVGERTRVEGLTLVR